jgi:Domain of unknown function (DUF4190)
MSYDAPPPPPPPQYGAPVPPYGAPTGTNQKAIWSLVCGIVGIICCGLISIVALFLGLSARKEIESSGQGGGGLATAGIVLGGLGIVWLVVSIILAATGHYYFDLSSS